VTDRRPDEPIPFATDDELAARIRRVVDDLLGREAAAAAELEEVARILDPDGARYVPSHACPETAHVSRPCVSQLPVNPGSPERLFAP
jgi:hypothetical protein